MIVACGKERPCWRDSQGAGLEQSEPEGKIAMTVCADGQAGS